MLFVSLRDLQWRRRRFLIGVLATGLVFALALVITGISANFHKTVSRTVRAFDADTWIVSEKATGPFTSSTLIGAQLTDAVRADPGVRDAAPLLVSRFTVRTSTLRDIGAVGVVPGHVGVPKVNDGRTVARDGEVVADSDLGVGLGRVLTIGGAQFRVVGRTSGLGYFVGQPIVFLTLPDAQRLAVGGQSLATAIVVRGDATHVPAGTHALSTPDVITDLRRPLQSATGTIDILRVLLWIVAAGIIGSILYLQAIERTRDFAVFKATGVTARSLVSGLAFQAVVIAIFSAIVAVVLAILLQPLMPVRAETPLSAMLVMPVIAVVVGLMASVSGLRRAVSVDPALAFGGA